MHDKGLIEMDDDPLAAAQRELKHRRRGRWAQSSRNGSFRSSFRTMASTAEP
jgi:endonuclease YncB( thermonuclease family)